MSPKLFTKQCSKTVFPSKGGIMQDVGTSTHSGIDIFGRIKTGVASMADTIKNAITSVTSYAQLVPIIISDSSEYDFKDLIERFAGCTLNDSEYRKVIEYIKTYGLSSNLTLPDIIFRVKREIAEKEKLQLQLQKQEDDHVISTTRLKCYEFCAIACEHLQRPINVSFTNEDYENCHSLYLEQYNTEFQDLFRTFRNFLNTNEILSVYKFPSVNSDKRDDPSEDDIYIQIVRKYILISNCTTISILQKFQSLAFATRIFGKLSEDVAKITNSSLGEIFEIPVTTIGLFLIWGAMSIELIDTAFGDIDIKNGIAISASLNVFSAMFIVALAREGIPPQLGVDMGITHCIQRAQQTVYNFFHDIAKPIIDFGIDFANVAFEKSNLDIVITKNKTWNELLYKNISSKITIEPIFMSMALPMLHTFRVADAFLMSLKNGRSIFEGTLKDNLLKISPLPQNGEETKLISLFWKNPYLGNYVVETGKPAYGLFFNYNQEIEKIYCEYTAQLTNDKVSFLEGAKDIYYSIRDLNNHIGKGNPMLFDNFLVYCIAGRLIDKHYKSCLDNISQHQLAHEISQYIHMNISPEIA